MLSSVQRTDKVQGRVSKRKTRLQLQEQLNRMTETAEMLRRSGIDREAYLRVRNQVTNVRSKRGYTPVYNYGEGLALMTRGQMNKLKRAVTVSGRENLIRRAANGQSVG